MPLNKPVARRITTDPGAEIKCTVLVTNAHLHQTLGKT